MWISVGIALTLVLLSGQRVQQTIPEAIPNRSNGGADAVVVLECVRIGSETLDECVLEFPAKGEKETSTPIRPDTADVMIGEPMADGSVHCSRNESMWEHWMRLGSVSLVSVVELEFPYTDEDGE